VTVDKAHILQSLTKTRVSELYRARDLTNPKLQSVAKNNLLSLIKPYVAETYRIKVAEPYQTPRSSALPKISCRVLPNPTLQSLTNTNWRTLPNPTLQSLNEHKLKSLTKPHVAEPYQTPHCRALPNTNWRALPNPTLQSLTEHKLQSVTKPHIAESYRTQVAEPYQTPRCRALPNTSCRALLNPCSMFQDTEQQQPDVARQRHVREHVQTAHPPSVGQQSHLWLSLGLAGTLAEEGAPPGAVHQVLLPEPTEGTERGRSARPGI